MRTGGRCLSNGLRLKFIILSLQSPALKRHPGADHTQRGQDDSDQDGFHFPATLRHAL